MKVSLLSLRFTRHDKVMGKILNEQLKLLKLLRRLFR